VCFILLPILSNPPVDRYPVRGTVKPSPPNKNALSIVILPRPLQADQSLSPPSSRTEQETPEADFDVDDEALAKEYNVEGVAEAVFGALDTGGLEHEELEDVDDLNDDGMSFFSLFFLSESSHLF
jgi:hypothetical protein